MDRLARRNKDIKGTVSCAWDREPSALTRLTAWHARRGTQKGTSSKLLWLGLSKADESKTVTGTMFEFQLSGAVENST